MSKLVCPNCGKLSGYHTMDEASNTIFKDKIVNFTETFAYCDKCNERVYPPEVGESNLNKIQEEYDKMEPDKITIRELQKEVHENAKAHGWWDNPRTDGELMMLMVSEVSEAFEEIRNNRQPNETWYSDNHKMEGVPSELADVVIRIMDYCEYNGIDLEKAILEKHEFNKTRPYKHGGKKL